MERKLHIVMFPWFAIGHMTPCLHLANNLANRGHKITLLLPTNAKLRPDPTNLHPSLITLHPITVPHVDPLPPGTETTHDIPSHLIPHLATAFDLTQPDIDSAIAAALPVDFLFYDLAHWAPEVAARYGIKSVSYNVVFSGMVAFAFVPAYKPAQKEPPFGYPSKTAIFRQHETNSLQAFVEKEFGSGITFHERSTKAKGSGDAIAFRTIKETEGIFCDYIARQYNKPVLLTGPILPESGPAKEDLDPKWAEWLGRFGSGSVVFCALGSEFDLKKDQFQELVLGFEMTKLPFLVAVKPPVGCATVDEAFPDGFEERVRERGVVHGGWVQQPQILAHRSVGCFVSHCGHSSIWESLLSECQIVLIPNLLDQMLYTRFMAEELKVGVEVEKESNGLVSKESLCKAIKAVMDEESEVGNLVRKNHAKWRKILVSPGFMNGYIDNFINDLEGLLV